MEVTIEKEVEVVSRALGETERYVTLMKTFSPSTFYGILHNVEAMQNANNRYKTIIDRGTKNDSEIY